MVEVELRNKQVVLKNYVSGLPKETDFEIIKSTIKLELSEDFSVVLVQNLYLSCDPFMIPYLQKVPGEQLIPLGTPILGFAISRVLHSTHPNFKKDDLVSGITRWEEFSIITDTQSHFKINKIDFPLSYYTGIFGWPGLCAYIGIYNICNLEKGDRVFISSASTTTGQLVGQFAKLLGCYVVACADSTEKIEFLKNSLGFDDAFNDKEEKDLTAALKRYFPQGIGKCFDNVGGKMLDAVLANMTYYGVIAATSPISPLDPSVPECFYNFNGLKARNITIIGFCAEHFFNQYPTYMEWILPWMKENKVIYEEDIVEGLENGPTTLVSISSAQNVRRKVILVTRE